MSTEITDELVKEFFQQYCPLYIGNLIVGKWEQFKDSKQPKPDWEVESYKHISTGRIVSFKSKELNESASRDPQYEIYSVKKLSDQQIFTIGDLIKFQVEERGEVLPIEKFDLDAFDKSKIAAWNSYKGIGFQWWEKQERQVAITTEDGVGYYDGELKNIYCLNTKDRDVPGSAWHIDTHPEYYSQLSKVYEHFFSTKEAAEEYKLFNAPLLSLEEIKRHGGNINYDNPYFKTLIQHAKEKLNQK
jgi:hypothetical protein